jgi:O-acetyl-ADP-ribose deacetylase (regulator of RNase III)
MTRIELARGDITEQTVDAIVNAANHSLLGGGGVDGAIHRAGGPEILAECRQLRATTYPDGLPTGRAAATTAGRLKAKWVIHTVGPVWAKTIDHSDQLESAYRESLLLAAGLGATSVAFPAISAGIYGWPMTDAARIAIETTRAVIAAGNAGPVELVRFVLFGDAAYGAFERALEG